MEILRIAYVDFWPDLDPEKFIFTEILRKKYNVEIVKDRTDVDLVFCSTFGSEYLKYKCIRILFTGEGYCPDFNIYDYAIGFERIEYEDRYLRYPLFLLNKKLFNEALNKHNRENDYFTQREGFCSFVVSAGGGLGDLRNWYFDKISEYKQIASGGKFRNNLPDGKSVPDKKAFQEHYKFSLCFENAAISGYVTEKIIDAYAAGNIPIYYGDTNIEKDFNPKSFIHVYGKEDLETVLDVIKKIDDNEQLYLSMVHQAAVLPDSPINKMLKDEYLENFLYNIAEQLPSKAIRRHSELTLWGHFYEYRLLKWNRLENNKIYICLQKIKRKIFGLKKID